MSVWTHTSVFITPENYFRLTAECLKGDYCMKTWKSFFLILMITGAFLMGCTTTASFSMDGLVPFEYFETVQKNDERLIIVTPALKEEFEYSYLYVLTNYEDMQRAQNKIGELNDLTLSKIDILLKGFSPVRIWSINTSPNYGEGIGIFSLPPTVDKLFFVYFIKYKKNSQNLSGKETMIFSEIMPLPPGKETTNIYFNERDGALRVTAMIDPRVIRNSFENKVERFASSGGGIYGVYYNSKPKPQTGFIPVAWQTRRDYASLLSPPLLSFRNTTTSIFESNLSSSDIGISDHKSILTERDFPNVGVSLYSDNYSSSADQYYRDRRATVDINSSYYTIQQETHSYSNSASWNLDVMDLIWVYLGGTNNNPDESQSTETRTYTIDVPTRQEVSFTLYRGNSIVYRGITPVRLIHLHPETEYTVRWVSRNGNNERKFTVGYKNLLLGQKTNRHHILFLD